MSLTSPWSREKPDNLVQAALPAPAPLPDGSIPRNSRIAGALKWLLHRSQFTTFGACIAAYSVTNVLHSLHWKHNWVTYVGMVFWCLDIILFAVTLPFLLFRLWLHRHRLPQFIQEPHSAIFIPLFILAWGTICLGVMVFAGTLGISNTGRLDKLYWAYLGLSDVLTPPLVFIWFAANSNLSLRSFALTGTFLVYPFLFNGIFAITTLGVVPPDSKSALAIWILAYIHCGGALGISSAFVIVYIHRCIKYGFLRGAAAGSSFVSCGPPGFAALVFLQLGKDGVQILPLHTPLTATHAEVIYYATIPFALCFWGIAAFLYLLALGPWLFTFTAHIRLNPAGGWATLFPATGFINLSAVLGDLFDAPAFYFVQAVFAGWTIFQFCLLFGFWVYRLFVQPDPAVVQARQEAWSSTLENFWQAAAHAEESEKALSHHPTPGA